MTTSAQDITWSDFLAALKEHYTLAASRATVRHMMYFMQILLDGLAALGLASAPVQALTAREMREILRWLETPDCPRHLQPASIKKFLMLVKAALNWGVDEGLLNENVIHQVKYKKNARYQPTPNLPPGALEALLAVTNDGNYTGQLMRAAIMLAVDTGMRPQELCGAKRQNLNRGARCLRIPEADAKTSGGLVSFGQTTGEALGDYLAARAKLPGADQAEHLFLNSRGQPLAYRHWHRLLKRYAALAGYPDICPYEFRVFFATAHFHLGTDQESVRKALRHKDAGMTRHYQRVSEEERAASDLFTHSLMDHMTRQGPVAANPGD
jgi:site-specific recombinase XerD